jgi:Beta-propeller repeat
MKRFMTLSVWTALLIVLLTACNTNAVEVQGTLTRQDFGTASSDIAYDVATPKGGVGAIVVGYTLGSLNGPNLGDYDAFIRRYDDGVGWASQFGTRSSDQATDVTVTSTGISYVVGETSGALRFKVGGQDVFLRKYDASGILQWTRQFGTTGNDYVIDVTLDSSGNVYVLSQDSGTSFRIRKFNTSGKLLQTITNTTAGVDRSSSLTVDSTGNIFVLTRFVSSSSDVARLFKYNNGGTLLASPGIYTGVVSVYPYDLIIDSSNNLYFSLFDDIPNRRGFIGKVNNSGASLWVRRIEPAATETSTFAAALALDSSGNLYVTGSTNGAYSGFKNAGSEDIFVMKYSPAGVRLWTRQFGGNNFDSGNGIAVSDVVYVAGISYSNPNLLGDSNYCGSSCNTPDAFLAQLSLANGSILGIDQ